MARAAARDVVAFCVSSEVFVAMPSGTFVSRTVLGTTASDSRSSSRTGSVNVASTE